MVYSQNWDLESIYPGGIASPVLAEKYTQLQTAIADFTQQVADYAIDQDADFSQLSALSQQAQQVESTLHTVGMFVNAQHSVDYGNPVYNTHFAKIGDLTVAFTTPLNQFSKILAQFEDSAFAQALSHETLTPIAFYLTELRQGARRLLDDATEALMNQLDLDGLTAWSQHYDTISAGLTLSYEDQNGDTQTISAGQALNMLDGEPDAATRQRIMTAYEKMWGRAENLSADTLNHLAGFRLTQQKAHQYTHHLEEPLEFNRMSKATLDAMWQVVDDNKGIFQPYFARKKQLLGLSQLGWQDQVAPITALGDYQPQAVAYDDAARFIIDKFAQFSPKMATFAEQAFTKQWIESENRPGKQPGGYMASVPDTKESRIFMTYTGSVNDAATLAHELGHAFHTYTLSDLPFWRDRYAMNVAETASTFAELIVADANVKAAQSDAEKVVLLDAKMSNPIAMFLNIRARFLFEDRFYQERQAGIVTPDRLNTLMSEAQTEAFGGALDVTHPHFWSSKLHFFIDDVPFYNFPYTFGYLFSAGIYAVAQNDPDFEDKYIALLRDTANMSVEELAHKHLGVDLTQADFWQAGADLIAQDIGEFLALSEQFI
jgi:pepF/M3 family oligoendopeptidase